MTTFTSPWKPTRLERVTPGISGMSGSSLSPPTAVPMDTTSPGNRVMVRVMCEMAFLTSQT